MAGEQMLLDRIAALGDRTRGRIEPSATEDVEALMESVRRHLARLLNARHGLSEALPDYGLPALSDLTVGSGDYMPRIQKAILNTITMYEPRLERVQVKRVVNEDGPQVLAFRVDATLVGKTGKHRVFYETSMAGSGEFEISE